MSTHDPISDLITRIRNAQMRSKSKVSSPGSKMRANVLEVLKAEGYIRGYASVEHASGRNELEIELKYFDGEPVIREIERVSKPGRRVYASVKNLPRVNNGLGISVLSTPKGIMADHEARGVSRPTVRRRCTAPRARRWRIWFSASPRVSRRSSRSPASVTARRCRA